MDINEEIKQSAYKDEYQKLVINQLFTGKWIWDIIAQHLKPYGLSSQQYNVLRILRGQDSKAISVNGISDRMIDKMSNVSRLVDKLKAKKLIRRKTNSIDRRQVDIEITEHGLNLLDEIDQQEDNLHDKFKNISLEEATVLNTLLDKLRG